jgi:ketosteroid isomerase-like protein
MTERETVQQALEALVAADEESATHQFTEDLVLAGPGGYLGGRITGLRAVLDRFAALSRRTGGTFGTEVEAVYGDHRPRFVVVTRHWAVVGGDAVYGTQALVLTTSGGRIRAIDALSGAGPASGLWD